MCYDDIDLTGVRSIDFNTARAAGGLAALRIVAGEPEGGTVLAEHYTTDYLTETWADYSDLKIGLDTQIEGTHQLCFVGLLGSGVFNLDYFTLSDQAGENNGPVVIELEVPEGPQVAPITTEGNQVLFGGEPDSIAGVSLFWSSAGAGAAFYSAETVDWLNDDWNADLVRVAVGADMFWGDTTTLNPGYLTHPLTNGVLAREVINAAIENGMYVIIDWHAHFAEDHKEQAIEFFQEMATTYGEFDNVIYEVYNEPKDASWPVVKDYAEDVIAAIRAIDPDNLIIVGTPFYSQRVDQASEDPINDENVAYTLHFYAGTHTEDVRGYARTALANGIPLFVTEWGTTSADGGTVDRMVYKQESLAWMDFLRENNISHANWSISNKDEEASILMPGVTSRGNWSQADLTESGQFVKDIIGTW